MFGPQQLKLQRNPQVGSRLQNHEALAVDDHGPARRLLQAEKIVAAVEIGVIGPPVELSRGVAAQLRLDAGPDKVRYQRRNQGFRDRVVSLRIARRVPEDRHGAQPGEVA